jgi:subtilase family serine protease
MESHAESARPTLLTLGRLAILSVTGLFLGTALAAQGPAPRLSADIDNAQRTVLLGSHSPKARPEYEAGRLPSGTPLQGISIVFSRSAAQEADLQALLTAQQDPASPLYRQWLTPEQFAARFGATDADIAKVQFWLQQQGFSLEGASRSKDRVRFSGTSQQVEAAFATELHYYTVNGHQHYAPSSDLSVPAALAPLVQTITNLSTFRPRSHIKIGAPRRPPQPKFTSSQTGSHFLTPGDIATIYDIKAAYNAGYTGAGQSIAAVGQTEIVLSDIENFQKAAGLTVKDPTLVLVPNTGTAAISSGDESESDLDLEYSGAIAKGATIYFVYVGNNQNYGVFDALTYAIDEQTAPVITISYGDCESDLGAGEYASLNAKLAQAASQGQTVVSASGDAGSTDCYGNTDQNTTEQEALGVDFPASSQYVTGMGGSEFPAADVAVGNTTYWVAQGTSDVISSALSYIPEQVWNDDSASDGLSAGGGGVSILTSRPTWQSGVTGIPSGDFRLVPDISLSASPNNAAFLFCSSDTTLGITGSCSHGFRDTNDTYLTTAGGTSFDAPIFAGMVAIINQKLTSTGQGVVNSTLYKLAGDAATYASAFHDITSGSNECTAGATYCSSAGEAEYPATAGYDQASGLGSVDFYNLLLAWPGASSSSPVASTTSLTAATTTPASGANDLVTISVASASNSSAAVPTGTLTVSVDGVTQTSALALSDGLASFTFNSTTSGAHTVKAIYSGDANYASSSGTLTLTVPSVAKTFTLSSTGVTVAAGNSATTTVTITPQNGYTGSIGFSVSASPAITNACFLLPNATISSASAVAVTLTVFTSVSTCASAAVIHTPGSQHQSGAAPSVSRDVPPASFSSDVFASRGTVTQAARLVPGTTLAFIGLLFVGLLLFRPRRWVPFCAIFLFAAIAAALSGCSSAGSSSSTTSTGTAFATKGSYTVTITGTDTASSSITASTTITLTVN